MADFDSSLPVRTVSVEELQVQTKTGTKLNVKTATAGDVAVKLVDSAGTNLATVSAAGAVKTDGSAVTQPVSGSVTVVQPTGTNLHAVLDATSTTTVTQATGTNLHTVIDSGTVTANIGTTNGLALDTTVAALEVTQGSTTSGQKGILGLGAVTTAAPTYTTAQTSPLSLNTAGGLRVDGSGSTQPISAASALPENLTQVAGTAVDVNTGNASAGTLRVVLASNQPTINVNTNPTDKTNVFDYNTASSIASNATSTHTYTPGSTVFLSQISASASGKMKVEIQYGTTGAETTRMVKFTTPGGGLSAVWTLPEPLSVTAAQSIKIIRTNMDNQAQDVYSTVEAWQ